VPYEVPDTFPGLYAARALQRAEAPSLHPLRRGGHKLKAPCPDVLYEYQGECYVPAFSAKPPPQSLGQ
jgi:hypothetical protein